MNRPSLPSERVTPADVSPGRSGLRAVLAAKAFALTAEITPPVSSDLSELLAKAEPLKGLADAVNVTDGAGARPHLDSLVAALTLLKEGVEPILQVTCRDRNRIALQSRLLGAAALGIVNLLLLKGDDPRAGDQPDAKPVFDLDTAALAETAVGMRDRGQFPYGRKMGGSADFFVGVADSPVDPAPDWLPVGLTRKIEAGAQFAQTQFCMDAQILRRYVARLRDSGVGDRISLLVGVAPLVSAKSARWIQQHLFGSIIPEWMIERLEKTSDPQAEGRALCLDLLKEYAEIPGVRGAHLMAPLNERAIAPVMEAFRTSR